MTNVYPIGLTLFMEAVQGNDFIFKAFVNDYLENTLGVTLTCKTGSAVRLTRF